MKRIAVLLSAVVVWPAYGQADGFVPGHIFIEESNQEPCWYFGINRIREIDPLTGQSWLFADNDDGLCGNSGMRFTPNGKRLRVADGGDDTIKDVDGQGNGTVVYDRADGLSGPLALAFDRQGYCYVANIWSNRILKFPPDGGPPTVFAQKYASGLAFAPNGDLFAAGTWERRTAILRITPQGEVSLFDGDFARFSDVVTVAFDKAGNLFVGVDQLAPLAGTLYRYDGGLRENKRLLASGFFRGASVLSITMSPDDSVVYLVDLLRLYAVDADDGSVTELFRVPEGFATGLGIAVYIPPVPGDLNCDGMLNAFDIEPFILALFDPAGYDAAYPHCDLIRADINGDGSINALDIEGFLELLFP